MYLTTALLLDSSGFTRRVHFRLPELRQRLGAGVGRGRCQITAAPVRTQVVVVGDAGLNRPRRLLEGGENAVQAKVNLEHAVDPFGNRKQYVPLARAPSPLLVGLLAVKSLSAHPNQTTPATDAPLCQLLALQPWDRLGPAFFRMSTFSACSATSSKVLRARRRRFASCSNYVSSWLHCCRASRFRCCGRVIAGATNKPVWILRW
jgi:hypothetical protein